PFLGCYLVAQSTEPIAHAGSGHSSERAAPYAAAARRGRARGTRNFLTGTSARGRSARLLTAHPGEIVAREVEAGVDAQCALQNRNRLAAEAEPAPSPTQIVHRIGGLRSEAARPTRAC